MKLRALLIVPLALVIAAAAFAQDAFDTQVADTSLLFGEPVQRELAITPDVVKELNKVVRGYSQKPAKTKKQADEMQAEMRKALMSKLSGSQLRRLRELTMQEYGTSLLGTRVIGARLGLGQQQQQAIAEIYIESAKQIREAIKLAIDQAIDPLKQQMGNDPVANKRLQADMISAAAQAQASVDADGMRRDADKRALAMLSDQQRAAWRALQGKPFSFGQSQSTIGTSGRPPQP